MSNGTAVKYLFDYTNHMRAAALRPLNRASGAVGADPRSLNLKSYASRRDF